MGHILLTVTFYPLKMAKIGFLNTFRPNRLTKYNLGAELTFLVAKIFYIPLPQYVSKSLGTLTQKVGNFPNPPLTAHCATLHYTTPSIMSMFPPVMCTVPCPERLREVLIRTWVANIRCEHSTFKVDCTQTTEQSYCENTTVRTYYKSASGTLQEHIARKHREYREMLPWTHPSVVNVSNCFYWNVRF